ncbi:hypothetical protein [Falsiroseomonas bella]|uniref:hypothetical protein n=1 Tax=Falsiroseomonas bella TaxID=2184016 RepID=UPI001304DC21|nr:hypothetical protein [Falsiroseomonas bella]
MGGIMHRGVVADFAEEADSSERCSWLVATAIIGGCSAVLWIAVWSVVHAIVI